MQCQSEHTQRILSLNVRLLDERSAVVNVAGKSGFVFSTFDSQVVAPEVLRTTLRTLVGDASEWFVLRFAYPTDAEFEHLVLRNRGIGADFLASFSNFR